MKQWATHQGQRYIAALLLFMLLLMTGGQPAFALEITDEFLHKNSVGLSKETLLLNDPDNRLKPETVIVRMSQPDFRSDELMPAGRQYWFYIPLINRTDTLQWSIRSDEPLADELDFYLHCQEQTLQVIPRPSLGFNSPYLASSQFFSISLPTNTVCGLLQRKRTALFDGIRISLVPHDKIIWQSHLKTTLALLACGIVIGLILYNFLLYLSLRNSRYLLYITYAIVHLITVVLFHFSPETLREFLASGRHNLRALGALTILFFVLFTLRFIQPGIQQLQDNPAKKRLYLFIKILVHFAWLMTALTTLLLLATIFHPDSFVTLDRINKLTYFSALLLIPLLSFMVAMGGYKPAWVFLPAWSVFVIGHMLFILDGLRIIELQGLGPTIAALAAALEMILLSIALGMTLRDSQRERDRATLAREHAELRMEQQEKFVSTLSHEIRTPLHAMLGSTTLLGRTPLSEKQQDYWNTTHYAAESMYELVDNLLDRTQAKQAHITDKQTTFEPQRLLEAMIHLLRSRAEGKNLNLSLHTEALPLYLTGNPVVLRRVLINTISNAVKYTDIGEITVSATWSANTSILHVTVKDTGHGIPPQQLKHIRQTFNMGVEALYSQQASSGLGLPICFEMLQETGGQLILESQVEHGTSVHFSLPMSLGTAPLEPTKISPSEQASAIALAVLVVDDVKTNRIIAQELLESAGHHVLTANDGKQALALTKEHAFDAVLSDVRMPGMDGTQLLEQLRQIYTPEELVIVMTSAHFSPQQQETFMTMGATVCLPKPHSPEALLTAIQGRDPTLTQPASSAAVKTPLDDETAAHIKILYDKQLEEDIARIVQAVSEQDMETIRIAAHRIVSASRALGMTQQAEAALKIETYHEKNDTINWVNFTQIINAAHQLLLPHPDLSIHK